MRAAIPLAIILVAVAVLVLFHGEESIGGFAPNEIASFAWLSAMGIMVFGWVARRFQGQWTRALEALAFWLAIMVALVALYSFRFDLAQLANRILGEIAPGSVVVAAGGEVSVSRRADGSFALAGRVNGHDTRFLFDTGASTVMLTAATARLAGLDPAKLDYSQPVATANGRTTAAAIVIDRLTIGGITEARVRALVARSGALSENLLGLSFLDRLASFEVKNDRLTLRGGRH